MVIGAAAPYLLYDALLLQQGRQPTQATRPASEELLSVTTHRSSTSDFQIKPTASLRAGVGNAMQATPRIACSSPGIVMRSRASHVPPGSGQHLHGDREHARVGCEGHAGCEHHLLAVTMKGTVVRAPSCGQGEGDVYFLVGFPACGIEMVFVVKKDKNPRVYYSLGFE